MKGLIDHETAAISAGRKLEGGAGRGLGNGCGEVGRRADFYDLDWGRSRSRGIFANQIFSNFGRQWLGSGTKKKPNSREQNDEAPRQCDFFRRKQGLPQAKIKPRAFFSVGIEIVDLME